MYIYRRSRSVFFHTLLCFCFLHQNSTFGDPPKYPSKAIPTADRAECIEQMKAVFSGGSFSKLKAAIYFNSLNSMISPDPSRPFGSPELAPALESMYDLDVFTANDNDNSSDY